MKNDRTHFILSNGLLRRKDDNLYFDKFDEFEQICDTKIIPINAVDEIYLLAKVFIDSYTLSFLADQNIMLHFFSPFGSFRGNFYPNTPNSVNKSGFVLLEQLRSFDDLVKRNYIARQITKARMQNAARNCHKRDIEFDEKPFITALEKTTEISGIMACEGAFAKAYFERWNEIIKDNKSFKFTVRSKRPPLDKINSFVSYVNTRIYNVCLSEIYKTELDPRIGFLHEPNYRAVSLHLDLAEIFKPIIGDNLIFTMLNKKEITVKDFVSDAGRIRFTNDAIKKIEMQMISKLCETFKIGEQTLTMRQIIRKEANKIKKCICENSPYEGFVF
ncbi:CRISPR-associated endonuclease Cas1 [Campylobacter hyointestinalis]|uniref:CRISPR-associated endonuclease Cas1 n=1 Tax=Campylobacter hyointestinalis TaxID=198 RepID=UPI000727D925|nr:CRISPR-associated endonuclease Cas1 [Campylobacter hyointestinalis]CUU67707.1 CRISPR-associated protein Cas1 [Campylobacter hyointestinalis subsp. hyointestinalis]CUU67810.1 CRISPR-associated protein Cas1 [Campylobacter hyointestinalis subsp. hyointestinalis]